MGTKDCHKTTTQNAAFAISVHSRQGMYHASKGTNMYQGNNAAFHRYTERHQYVDVMDEDLAVLIKEDRKREIINATAFLCDLHPIRFFDRKK